MEKHFILTDETKTLPNGVVLHRIKCTRDCLWAKEGEFGGWIEKECNLSDNAWVSDDAWVYGNAQVSDNAWVYDDAWVYGNARVYDDARVYGNAQVSGNARVSDDAWVSGNARVSDDALIENSRDYCCFQSFGSRNDTTTACRQKDGSILIKCGCFSGSLKDFVEKVEKTHGANRYGKEYLAIANVIKVRFGIA